MSSYQSKHYPKCEIFILLSGQIVSFLCSYIQLNDEKETLHSDKR